jgi:prepilin-type N-terminal cleavage/methylation domain-containing protein
MIKTLNPKRLLTTHYSLPTSNAGFTLVEVLVATAIIAILSVALLFNFGNTARNRTARSQVASVVVSDIRRAQSMALSGARFGGNAVCGYGIHYVNHTSYLLYAGANEGLPRCQDANHNYQTGVDSLVENRALINSNMEFRSSFSDIFFEPPDPKTYINNSASLTDPPATIVIQRTGQTACGIPQTCAQIDVYTSGQINLTD